MCVSVTWLIDIVCVSLTRLIHTVCVDATWLIHICTQLPLASPLRLERSLFEPQKGVPRPTAQPMREHELRYVSMHAHTQINPHSIWTSDRSPPPHCRAHARGRALFDVCVCVRVCRCGCKYLWIYIMGVSIYWYSHMLKWVWVWVWMRVCMEHKFRCVCVCCVCVCVLHEAESLWKYKYKHELNGDFARALDTNRWWRKISNLTNNRS